MRGLIICFLLMFPILSNAQSLIIDIQGDPVFDANVSISEAGLDFDTELESQTPVYLSVLQSDLLGKNTNPNNKWVIHVNTEDSWESDLSIEAKRTGNGFRVNKNGKPKIWGGETYLPISNNSNLFFSGKGELQEIPINFRIIGLSVLMGAGNFETSIVFTVYDD